MERLQKPLSDEALIDLYWQRDESAITETDRKYRNYLLSLAYPIVSDKLDCEECLSDTYLGTWNAIPPTKPRILKAFLAAILRRTAINRYHHSHRKGAIPTEMTVALSELEPILGTTDAVAEFEAKRLGKLISDFTRSLTPRRRYIFISRYYSAQPIDAIAKQLSLSRSMVNKELAAIRTDLKATLEKEGYTR